jgi:hypothetical protein
MTSHVAFSVSYRTEGGTSITEWLEDFKGSHLCRAELEAEGYDVNVKQWGPIAFKRESLEVKSDKTFDIQAARQAAESLSSLAVVENSIEIATAATHLLAACDRVEELEQENSILNDDLESTDHRLIGLKMKCACPACGCADEVDAIGSECGCDSIICTYPGTIVELVGSLVTERDMLAKRVEELESACRKLLDADHHDHFAVRMSDSEMEGIEAIKAALNDEVAE